MKYKKIQLKLPANSKSVETIQIAEITTNSVVIVQRSFSNQTTVYPIYAECIENGKLRIYFSASNSTDLSMKLNVVYSI